MSESIFNDPAVSNKSDKHEKGMDIATRFMFAMSSIIVSSRVP